MKILFAALAVLLLHTPGLPESVLAEETEIAAGVQLPPGALTSEELLDLFKDHTVYSVTALQRRESVSYYDPNGEVRQLRDGVTRKGFWRVTENGRICLQMEDLPEKCRIVVKEKGTYKKYIVKKNGLHQHSVSYPAFRKGNPLGL